MSTVQRCVSHFVCDVIRISTEWSVDARLKIGVILPLLGIVPISYVPSAVQKLGWTLLVLYPILVCNGSLGMGVVDSFFSCHINLGRGLLDVLSS